MISSKEIIDRLAITEQQFVMARYSGRLPSPNEDGLWERSTIEDILNLWEAGLIKKRKELSESLSKNLHSGEKMEFPRHSR